MGKLADRRIQLARHREVTGEYSIDAKLGDLLAKANDPVLKEVLRTAQQQNEALGRTARKISHRIDQLAKKDGLAEKQLIEAIRIPDPSGAIEALEGRLRGLEQRIASLPTELPEIDQSATHALLKDVLEGVTQDIVIEDERPTEWVFEIERYPKSGAIKQVIARGVS